MANLTGATINVYSEKTLAIEPGARGTAAIALPLDWYDPAQPLQTIGAGEDTTGLLGYPLGEGGAFLVGEMLKRAGQALVFNLNSGGMAAQGVLGSALTVQAARAGSRGNDLAFTAEAEGEGWRLRTYLDGGQVDSQWVADAAHFAGNSFVLLQGEGQLQQATVQLAGGSDGTQAQGAFGQFLQVLQNCQYQTVAYTGEDPQLMQQLAAYVQQRRENGQYVQAVMAGYEADSEAVISFANGVVLADGRVVTAAECSAYLAGAAAAAQLNESLTYDVYDQAVDVSPRLTRAQQLAYKEQGLGCFILNNGRVKIESDINTLVTYTSQKGADFAKNRVVRVLDAVCGDICSIFDSSYAGRENNNLAGRNRFKASICDYLAALQGMQAIEGYTADDVQVLPGSDKDQVLVDLHIQPVDSMEKAHITLWVR